MRNSFFGFVRKSFCIMELFCQTTTDNHLAARGFYMERGGIYIICFDFRMKCWEQTLCECVRMCKKWCENNVKKVCDIHRTKVIVSLKCEKLFIVKCVLEFYSCCGRRSSNSFTQDSS